MWCEGDILTIPVLQMVEQPCLRRIQKPVYVCLLVLLILWLSRKKMIKSSLIKRQNLMSGIKMQSNEGSSMLSFFRIYVIFFYSRI